MSTSTQLGSMRTDAGTEPDDAMVGVSSDASQARGSAADEGRSAAGVAASATAGASGSSVSPPVGGAAGSGSLAQAGSAGSVAAVCGNGVLEAGELCDGSNCPTECAKQSSCRAGRLVGDAATCDAQCVAEEITNCENDDGCCAASCNHENDNDCSASCGDGVITAGEKCESSSQEQACPTSESACDDKDACTADMLIGTAAQCTAECLNTPIDRPRNADGCCPEGANANNDNDCETRCGDGVITGDETCDGDCRASCAAPRGCTREVLVGSPSACNVRCMSEVVTQTINNDGCCPSGKLRGEDNDCSDECNSAADCDGRPGECSQLTCSRGTCETEPLRSGAACGSGGTCDGNGTCVQPPEPTEDLSRCQTQADCTGANQQCSMSRCIPSCSTNASPSCRLSNGGAGLCINNICVPDCGRGASVCSQYGLQCKAYDKCGCFMVCDIWNGLGDPMSCDGNPCSNP